MTNVIRSRTKDMPVHEPPVHLREHVAMFTATKSVARPTMPATVPAHLRDAFASLGYRDAEPAATPPRTINDAAIIAIENVGRELSASIAALGIKGYQS